MSLDGWLDDLGGQLRAARRTPERRRGTRRAAATLLALAAIAGVVAVAALRPNGEESPVAAPLPPPRSVPAAEVLGEPEPYMGVACPEPNRVGCDRVGLAVWLRLPAASVSAEIGGREFELDADEWTGHAGDGYRSAFAGFLQPAGLVEGDGPLRVRPDGPDGRWLGGRVVAPVTLTIAMPSGERLRTRVDVSLAAGWG